MFRLAFLLCLVAVVPVAFSRRARPRSEVPKGVPASMIQKEDDPSDLKEELSGKGPVEDVKPVNNPSYYDPGRKGLCPKIVPETGGGGTVSLSMVIVTVKNAQNLPWSMMDHPDAFVEFWTGEEGARQYYITKKLPGQTKEMYWRARTQVLGNDTTPLWDWSCLLVYNNTNPTITFQVWDRDLVTNADFLGKASGNMIEIFQAEDTRGDGEFDVKFKLRSAKGDVMVNNKGEESTLTVHFDIVREPSLYETRRNEGFQEAQISREIY